jgi:hypothetical protein
MINGIEHFHNCREFINKAAAKHLGSIGGSNGINII